VSVDASLTSDGWLDQPLLGGLQVYVLFGVDDAPLYIGQSTNVFARLGEHLRHPAKRAQVARIAVRECASKADMDETEQRLIAAHCPPWNTASLPVDVLAERLQAKRAAEIAHAASWAADRPADPPPSAPLRTWFTTAEAAKYLGCHEKTVRRARARGQLRGVSPAPATPGGPRGNLRFRSEWLDRFREGLPPLDAAPAHPAAS
jgi:excisionase family DNA binding protein